MGRIVSIAEWKGVRGPDNTVGDEDDPFPRRRGRTPAEVRKALTALTTVDVELDEVLGDADDDDGLVLDEHGVVARSELEDPKVSAAREAAKFRHPTGRPSPVPDSAEVPPPEGA